MKRKILKSKDLPIYRYTTNISGKKISRDIIHKQDISIIIAFKNNSIVIVSQNRFPNGNSLELPSGLVEKHEKPIDAAYREFSEETGYKAKKMIPFFSFYSWIGYSNQKVYCFIAKDFTKSGTLDLDKNELISPKIINFQKFLKLVKNGKIHEPCTIITTLTFAMKKNLI
tara:strand:+ start:8732 stop:9241 length:510 start_codon:yes stop_codon:yes gene_type:complete